MPVLGLLRACLAHGAFYSPCELDTRGDIELAEDVAQVGLDRLVAEEELRGDLGVGSPVDDQLGHLELTGRQGLDPFPVALAGAGPPVHSAAELAELALGL